MALRSKTAEAAGSSLFCWAVGLVPFRFTVVHALLPMCDRCFTCLNESTGKGEYREINRVSGEMLRF